MAKAKAPVTVVTRFDELVFTILNAREKLSTSERVVLLSLCQYQGGRNQTWVAQTTLASNLSISRVVVNHSIKSLQEKGFLTTTRRGLGQSNTYVIHASEIYRKLTHSDTSIRTPEDN